MRVFDVYLLDAHAGTLAARGRGVRFQYTERALDDDALPALSLSLPKRAEPFADSAAGPFFRNLLPEQAYRRLVAAATRTAPEDSLGLLGAVGGECPGAVSIWPAGTRPPATPEYRSLDAGDLAALFAPGDRTALSGAIARGRLSLPGVQEKVALLRRDDGSWALPVNGAVTSHILKQATGAFPGLLANELLTMILASDAGLPAAPTALAGPGVEVLCVERFDRAAPRAPHGPARRRLHQEDFCQILGVEPERKYEFDGGPGISACAAVLRRHSALPAEDLERLVRWLGFDYLVGNEDAHAKNLALLYRDDGLRLAPHYDLVCTEIYEDLERRLAMKVGGASDIRNVQRRDWERCARGVGLPWALVRSWLLGTAEAVRSALPGALAKCAAAAGESATLPQIAAVVERRSSRMEKELAGRAGSPLA